MLSSWDIGSDRPGERQYLQMLKSVASHSSGIILQRAGLPAHYISAKGGSSLGFSLLHFNMS